MIKQKRQYNNEFPSVTQVLGILRKPALEYWFKVNTLEFINRESGKGREIGTQIHQVIQDYIETGKADINTEYPEEVTNALNSFVLFKKEHPEYSLKKSEILLTGKDFLYNGTIDCIGEIDGKLIIADWKTSKCGDKEKPDIYDEYLYQVAAYVNLYEENYSEIKGAIIVSIAKDKPAYNLYVMTEKEIENCFFEVFVPALQIYNYQKRKD